MADEILEPTDPDVLVDPEEPEEPEEPIEPEIPDDTEVGYVTFGFANQYVTEHFTSTDPLRESWEALSGSDKLVLLRRSFESIEMLPFTGRKYCCCQKTAFPRWPNEDIPDAVIAAQIENAVSLSDETTAEDAAFYQRMWQFGIESYKIGNLSEKMGSGAWGDDPLTSAGIISSKASQLLQPFLSGVYGIKGPQPPRPRRWRP